MLTDKQKDKEIENMLKQDKSYREIMTTLKVGPNRIDKVKGQLTGQSPKAPTYTSAYQLFHSGKSRYDVAVELQITEKEARAYEYDYHKLDGADKLSHLCQSSDTTAIMRLEILARELDKIGIRPSQYDDYFVRMDRVDNLTSQEKALNESIAKLTREKQILKEQDEDLRRNNLRMQESTFSQGMEVEVLKREEKELLDRKNHLILDINHLIRKRNEQLFAVHSAPAMRLSRIEFKKEAEEFIESILPDITDGIRSFVESQNSMINAHNLFHIELDLESHLREKLKEPVPGLVLWLAEKLVDNLIITNR